MTVPGPSCLRRLATLALAASLAVLFVPASAAAVPAFARKYQTSCQTCHVVFPKLNAFGEAFRLRGYRMPAENQANCPSFFSDMTFAENPDGSVAVELEHAGLDIDSPFGREDMLHFRIGKMAPNLAGGFQEMWISTDAPIDSVFSYNPIGVNGGTGFVEDATPAPVALPASVRGIEAYGIIKHRILWVFGAYLHGTDQLQLLDPTSHEGLGLVQADSRAWFVQADYVFYPWLQGSGRYETVTPADPAAAIVKRGVATLNALIRANV